MKHAIQFIICFIATITTASNYVLAQDSSPILSKVINPVIPNSVVFAGETVNLDRIDMYERFDRELASMVYTHGNTLLTIKRANRFFPEIAPLLDKHGIPLDFMYLACIESVLNHRAYSSAKAAGIWQFIPSTAKQYGLEVNKYVDERLNLEKATSAVCRYLKTEYDKYGNWESAACAFNGGPKRIADQSEIQQVSTSYDLYLTEETSRYMFRILAAKTILENPKAYGFYIKREQLYYPVEYEIVTVDYPVKNWTEWAKEYDITYSQLREQNPWIISNELPNQTGKVYRVKVPKKESLYRSTQNKTVYNPNWVID